MQLTKNPDDPLVMLQILLRKKRETTVFLAIYKKKLRYSSFFHTGLNQSGAVRFFFFAHMLAGQFPPLVGFASLFLSISLFTFYLLFFSLF